MNTLKITFAAMLIAMFFSCRPKLEKSETAINQTNATTNDYHSITKGMADTLIFNFVNKFPQAKNNAFCGTFKNPEQLTIDAQLFYSCLDTGKNKMFFATHHRGKYDTLKPADFELNGDIKLDISTDNQKCPINVNSYSTMGAYLEKQGGTLVNSTQLNYSIINGYRVSFVNQVKVPTYGYGAFSYDEVDALRKLPGVAGIRCYWGFDSNNNVNQIRLVIFAVNNMGNNLFGKIGNTDYLILDKAWP